ncbi:MAG: TIGR00266 family protein [Chloroflexota bacterium]|nr:TIGR00266 family protein [Chloroflexota bacterium]MDE2839239.1 TIGR00266 family protein [Chloroflexota bacterium]MDE2931415.1 TIGR00266 family protein [Chloroflexota bacterium]
MEYEILHRPSYALLKVDMAAGESVSAEAGAMVSMSSGIEIETSMRGGLFGGLRRKFLGGESFFINTFSASQSGEVNFAPSLPGDIYAVELNNEVIFAQSGSFIASTEGVEVDSSWGGAKTFFSGEGLFLLRISGSGTVFLSSYGAIHEIMLDVGQSYTVDTGHMVSFAEGVGYDVRRVGGLKSTFFSGEGLVVELTGPGTITIQSRSTDAFLAWLIPHLPSGDSG